MESCLPYDALIRNFVVDGDAVGVWGVGKDVLLLQILTVFIGNRWKTDLNSNLGIYGWSFGVKKYWFNMIIPHQSSKENML